MDTDQASTRGINAIAVARPRPEAIDSLTSIRWLSALYVYLFHVEVRHPLVRPGAAHNLLLNGYAGMALFFVLSGFVLTVRYLDSKTSYGTYIRARFARIYPAYLCASILSLPLLIKPASIHPGLVGFDIFADVTLTNAWFPPLWNLGINGGTWSLSVEAFFYALFPALLTLLAVCVKRGRTAFLLLALLWMLSFLPGLEDLLSPDKSAVRFYYSVPIYRLPEFMIGIVLALAWHNQLLPRVRWPVVVAMAAGLVIGGMFHGPQGQDSSIENPVIFNLISVPMMAVLIWWAADARPAWLENPILVYLGKISYGFYLYQFLFFYYLLWRMPDSVPVWLTAIVGLCITIAIAALSYHLIEEPLRAFINRRRAR